MCVGNRAEGSVHYINSQLLALWENAQRCVAKHGTGFKPVNAEIEYGTILYEYHGPGKYDRHEPSHKDLNFYAVFNPPKLEFVCNHEIVLFLNVENGNYKVESKVNNQRKVTGETFSKFTFAFRLEWNTHSIKNIIAPLIGNQDSYDINLVVLNIETARFCPELSHVSGVSDVQLQTLVHFVQTHYLQLFKRAGHHTLHGLPDFDRIAATSAHIDYSVINTVALSTTEVFGISVETINNYLKGLWLTSAGYVDENEGCVLHHEYAQHHFLAEIRTHWSQGVESTNFHLKFGPLSVRALCKREVVLYLDIQEVEIFLGGSFGEQSDHLFQDWKLAFLVDIAYEETEQGNIKRVILDLSTLRFCEYLSHFKGEIEHDLLIHYRETLVRYIITEYITILKTVGYHIIYHIDHRIPIAHPTEPPKIEPPPSCPCKVPSECSHGHGQWWIYWGWLEEQRRLNCHTHGFDMVTAVTQGAINQHFKWLWASAEATVKTLGPHPQTWASVELENSTLLSEWSVTTKEFGETVFFNASFGEPQVQFVCSEGSQSAVFYVNIQEGYLRTLDRKFGFIQDARQEHIENWRLAFSVDLKLVPAAAEVPILEKVMKHMGRTTRETFLQLILDFSSAKFLLSASSVPGLIDENDFRLIRDKRRALFHYLTHYYFPAFARAGHHVLYTIPLKDKSAASAYALNDVAFQVYPFIWNKERTIVDNLYGRYGTVSEYNMIVFLGMTGDRTLNNRRLPHCGNWVIGAGNNVTHGVICLSRSSFLETILLNLEEINKLTTIIPAFAGEAHHGEWDLHLRTWATHEFKRKKRCQWTEGKVTPNALLFEWNNRDDWTYEHEDDFGEEANDGKYSVKALTKNVLSIPTTHVRGSCAIVVKGRVELRLGFAGVHKSWSSKLSADWSATITLTSDYRRGMQIQITPSQIVPNIVGDHPEGTLGHSTYSQAFASLQEQMPKAIGFEAIVNNLTTTFSGIWSHLYISSKDLIVCNAEFNSHGDVILELREKLALPADSHPPRSPGSGVSTPTSSRAFLTKGLPINNGITSPPPTAQTRAFLTKGLALNESELVNTETLETETQSQSQSQTRLRPVQRLMTASALQQPLVSPVVISPDKFEDGGSVSAALGSKSDLKVSVISDSQNSPPPSYAHTKTEIIGSTDISTESFTTESHSTETLKTEVVTTATDVTITPAIDIKTDIVA